MMEVKLSGDSTTNEIVNAIKLFDKDGTAEWSIEDMNGNPCVLVLENDFIPTLRIEPMPVEGSDEVDEAGEIVVS